jgi:hypothetical protein
MQFRFSYEKNSELIRSRGIGFEEIINVIADGNLLDIKNHHNQEKNSNQKILYVRILEEVYAVPYIEEESDTIFLKTLFASRKARKFYLVCNNDDN